MVSVHRMIALCLQVCNRDSWIPQNVGSGFIEGKMTGGDVVVPRYPLKIASECMSR
jgi:hypothetical protein